MGYQVQGPRAAESGAGAGGAAAETWRGGDGCLALTFLFSFFFSPPARNISPIICSLLSDDQTGATICSTEDYCPRIAMYPFHGIFISLLDVCAVFSAVHTSHASCSLESPIMCQCSCPSGCHAFLPKSLTFVRQVSDFISPWLWCVLILYNSYYSQVVIECHLPNDCC